MRLSLLISALLASGFLASSAYAMDPVDVGMTVGTLGAGPEVGMVIVPNQYDARLSASFFSYSYNKTSSNVTYTGNLQLQNIALMGDWHPFAGSFRLTGGVMYNGNNAGLTAQPAANGTYTFNGNTYTSAQVGSAAAKVNFNALAPYLGLGWGDDSATAGFHFTSDIGLMYQGAPNVTLTVTNPTNNAQLASDVQAAQSKLQSDLNSLQIYPVVRVGVNYRF